MKAEDIDIDLIKEECLGYIQNRLINNDITYINKINHSKIFISGNSIILTNINVRFTFKYYLNLVRNKKLKLILNGN